MQAGRMSQETPHTPLAPGTLIEGRYAIEALLGEGGFARIYRAQHVFLRRTVAVKVLDALDPGIEHLEMRFLREAQTSAALQHPNIVHVYDFGFTERPERRPFIVMEYLSGADLFEVLDGGPFTPTRAIELFIPALDGLAVAHEAGIIHRDLKPTNLLLRAPGSSGEALVILDFGIAALAPRLKATAKRGDPRRQGRLTELGQILGTPRYTAPEYIESHAISTAFDVYQMGLILVEMLTGYPVITEDNPHLCFNRHLNGDLRLPQALLESPLGPVIQRATDRDPAARYPEAAAFRDALEPLRGLADIPGLPDFADAIPTIDLGSSSITGRRSGTSDVDEAAVTGVRAASPRRVRNAIVVDADHQRRARTEACLQAAQTSTLPFDVWEGANEVLWRRDDISLIVLTLAEILRRRYLTEVICAELHNTGVPVVVIIEDEEREALDRIPLLRYTPHHHPSAIEILVHDLDRAAPGIADVPDLEPDEIDGSGPGAAVRAWVGWLEDVSLVELQTAPRLLIPMPSLSSGSIAEVPVARLLYLHAIQRRSGTLTLTQDRLSCAVTLHQGRADTSRELLATFAWTRGDYRFQEDGPAERSEARNTSEEALLQTLYTGIRRHSSFNDIASHLAPHDHHLVAFTTKLTERRRVLARLGKVLSIFERCDGRTTLSRLITQTPISLEETFHALALGLLTDSIVFLDAPTEPPVGLTYALRTPKPDELAHLEEETGTFARIARLEPNDKQILGRLQALNKELQQGEPYAVFGLSPGCGADAVRATFYQLAKRHHPSHYQIYDGTFVKVVAELIFEQLRGMCVTLLSEEGPSRRSTPSNPRPDAGALFKLGLDHLRNKDVKAASEAFSTASRLEPANAELLGYRAWCLFLLKPEHARKCRALLEKAHAAALEADAPSKDVLLFLVRICKHLGEVDDARGFAQAAVEGFPDSRIARAELEKLS